MCLVFTPTTNKVFYNDWKIHPVRRIYYKVVFPWNNELRSVIMSHFVWEIGWNISTRSSASIDESERYTCDINSGIHVYTTHITALRHKLPNELILPVYCDINDFVAYDSINNEAVFTKVFVEKEHYQEALQGKS